MQIILLTRPGNLQGIKTLEECQRRGVRIAAAIVEPKTWAEKARRVRRFYRANGLVDTLRKACSSARLRADRTALASSSSSSPRS